MNDQDNTIVTNAQALATTRTVTVVLFSIALALAYWVWPSGITDLALGSIQLGTLLRAIASGAIVIVSCCIAFFLWIE